MSGRRGLLVGLVLVVVSSLSGWELGRNRPLDRSIQPESAIRRPEACNPVHDVSVPDGPHVRSEPNIVNANPRPSPQSVPLQESERSAADLLQGTFLSIAGAPQDDKSSAFVNPLASWHQRFADDGEDPVWSPMAQSQTEVYIKKTLSPNIELVAVKCGASVCEIQAASTTAANSESAANEWQLQMSSMSSESWWPTFGFGSPSTAIWAAPDGRALVVSYLPRASIYSEP